jgi:hypothetical protein
MLENGWKMWVHYNLWPTRYNPNAILAVFSYFLWQPFCLAATPLLLLPLADFLRRAGPPTDCLSILHSSPLFLSHSPLHFSLSLSLSLSLECYDMNAWRQHKLATTRPPTRLKDFVKEGSTVTGGGRNTYTKLRYRCSRVTHCDWDTFCNLIVLSNVCLCRQFSSAPAPALMNERIQTIFSVRHKEDKRLFMMYDLLALTRSELTDEPEHV